MIRIWIAVFCALSALSVGVMPVGGGTSGAAYLCKNNGWQDWLRDDETPFKNQGACVSYAVHGGLLTTVTTSTTQRVTRARVDLPVLETFRTRVTATFLSILGSHVLFDQTSPHRPESAEVSSLFGDAHAALLACAQRAPRPQGEGSVVIGPPLLLSSSQTTETVFVREELDHTDTRVITTRTIGPATIMVGQNKSEEFFVQGGTMNIDRDTHTELFVNDVYQTTVANVATYGLTGQVTPHSDICPA